MKVSICKNKSRWNQFVNQNNGPVFSIWEWGEVCQAYNHRVLRLVAYDNSEIVAALPLVHIQSSIFNNALVSMPFSEHGSTIMPGSDGQYMEAREKLMNKAVELANEYEVDYLCLRGDRINIPDEFIKLTRYVTFLLDVTASEQIIWNNFTTRFRNGVRKAEDANVTIQIANSTTTNLDFDPIRVYYDLHLQTMRRHGSPPHSLDFFKEIWKELVPRDSAHFFFGIKEGKPINAALIFTNESTINYWGSVSDLQFRELNAGSQILWEIIKWGESRKYSELDLGRTRPDTGVYRYKSGLNAKEIHLDDVYYFPNQFVSPPDPENSRFKPLVKAWKKLPISVIKIIGPQLRGQIP